MWANRKSKSPERFLHPETEPLWWQLANLKPACFLNGWALMESDYVDYNICCLTPKTSRLLFALMKAGSAQLWRLYICSHIHCPSHAGRRAVATICFYLPRCYWANSGEVCGSKAALLVGQGIIYAPPSPCPPLCCLAVLCFTKTHRGLTCRLKMLLWSCSSVKKLLRWRKEPQLRLQTRKAKKKQKLQVSVPELLYGHYSFIVLNLVTNTLYKT